MHVVVVVVAVGGDISKHSTQPVNKLAPPSLKSKVMNEGEIDGGKRLSNCIDGKFCGAKSTNVNRGNKMVGNKMQRRERKMGTRKNGEY